MRRRGIALAVLLTAVGCGRGGSGRSQHPLAGRDPAAGFVSAAYADALGLVETGLSAEMGNPDRLLAAGDPLGIARLVLLDEQQLGTGQPGNLPPTSDADGPLNAFLNADLSAILPLAAETLDDWATLSVALEALGLANLLDQVGALPQQAVGSIRGAADLLRTAIADRAALDTLDWAVLLPNLPDGPVKETIFLHAPAPRLSRSLSAAARGVVDAVAAALTAGWPDAFPFSPDAAPDAAIQTLLRAPTIVDFSARPDLSTPSTAFYVAHRTLAGRATGRRLAKDDWDAYAAAGAAWHGGVVMRSALIERSTTIPLDVAGWVSPAPAVLDDPNARRFVPNVASDTRVLTRPWVEFRTAADATPPVGFIGLVLPSYVAPLPSPTPTMRTAPIPDTLVPVRWTVHTSVPLDHLDLRIRRGSGPEFLHFIYRPTTAGLIATATVFDPASSPTGVGPAGFRIEAIAVDVLGRFSPVASTVVRATHAPSATEDRKFFIDEAGVISFTSPEAHLGSVSGSSVVCTGYTRSDGGRDVLFLPSTLAGLSGGASVTFRNDDTVPHHLRSVYTPLHTDDPSSTPAGNAIGGLLPLDFGTVAPGGSSTISLPAAIPAGYRWTLLDVLIPAGAWLQPVLLTSEPAGGLASTPIGG